MAGAAFSADAEAAEQEAERAWQAEEEAAAEQARHDELQKLQASSRLLRIHSGRSFALAARASLCEALTAHRRAALAFCL